LQLLWPINPCWAVVLIVAWCNSADCRYGACSVWWVRSRLDNQTCEIKYDMVRRKGRCKLQLLYCRQCQMMMPTLISNMQQVLVNTCLWQCLGQNFQTRQLLVMH
jgi:hypothetical protein